MFDSTFNALFAIKSVALAVCSEHGATLDAAAAPAGYYMEDLECIYGKAKQIVASSSEKSLLSELIAFATTAIHSRVTLGRLFSCWIRVSRIRSNLKTPEEQSHFIAAPIRV
jgi:hypothetical protein